MKNTAVNRAITIQTIRAAVESGTGLRGACAEAGVSVQWFNRWNGRFLTAGVDGLHDLPRSGRPPCCVLTDDDKKALRSAYLRSNLRDRAGSMTLAARMCAKDGKLSAPVAEAILRPRSSKHCLPLDIKRAVRASAAEVARYRDPDSGLNDGQYTPGWLRMSDDGSRRLCPNERWVGDDASVNVGVCVPWERGGDKCSNKFKVRVARFQLLALIDCATDFCVGYSYVLRSNDAYTAADVVNMMWRVATLRGGMPYGMVCEGGSWQAERTVNFLKSSGCQLISAKGRPNQKLIEGWFNRLWSVMSIRLPAYGQIGRKRGEMAKENDLWMRCRKGIEDPRKHFPMLSEFYSALDSSIDYCNTEVTGPTRNYGSWIPAESYAAKSGAFPAMDLLPLAAGIRRYALPVRERRIVRRGGMAFVRAVSPLGFSHEYAFAMRDGAMFDGAPAFVSFDPSDPQAGAVFELAEHWHDLRAGRVLDESAVCISSAPVLDRTQSGFWHVGFLDPRREAAAVKRNSRALVGTRVAAFDERGVVARHDETFDESGAVRDSFGLGDRPPAPVPVDLGYDNDVDLAALERAAGIA